MTVEQIEKEVTERQACIDSVDAGIYLLKEGIGQLSGQKGWVTVEAAVATLERDSAYAKDQLNNYKFLLEQLRNEQTVLPKQD